MNYLRRRLSDSTFISNLPNGYMTDLQRPDNAQPPPPATATATNPAKSPTTGPTPPATSPAPERKPPSSQSSGAGFFSSITNVVKQTAASAGLVEQTQVTTPKKFKILLVIDEPQQEWAKLFRGKKILGDYDIKVEQAEFNEINVVAHANGTCNVNMQVLRNGTKVIRSFKPDFVLVRQHAFSMTQNEDFRNMIIGLQYGGVPCINSLESIYNLCDKPWAFAQLINTHRKLGAEKFPLIEQTFYPNYKEMLNPSDFKTLVVTEDSSVVLNQLNTDEQGTYRCSLQDPRGTVYYGVTFLLSVAPSPDQTHRPLVTLPSPARVPVHPPAGSLLLLVVTMVTLLSVMVSAGLIILLRIRRR